MYLLHQISIYVLLHHCKSTHFTAATAGKTPNTFAENVAVLLSQQARVELLVTQETGEAKHVIHLTNSIQVVLGISHVSADCTMYIQTNCYFAGLFFNSVHYSHVLEYYLRAKQYVTVVITDLYYVCLVTYQLFVVIFR